MDNTTQKAIAEKLGIPPPLLSAALKGTRRISYELAHKIEQEHGIPIKVFRKWAPLSLRRVLSRTFGRFRMNTKRVNVQRPASPDAAAEIE